MSTIAIASAALALATMGLASEPDTPSPSLSAQMLSVPVADSEMVFYISGSGQLPVVLLAGYGGDHRTWEAVQPKLSRFARVVSYDRPGWGGSAPSKRPRHVLNFVEELRQALYKAGLAPPYLLVGHSYGGTIAKLFASRHPRDVAGLVLVDPGLEGFYRRAAVEAPHEYLHELEELQAQADSAANETLQREFSGFDISMQQLRVAPAVQSRNVAILSASEMDLPPRLRSVWLDEHARWAKSVNATHIYVKSGHRIPRQVPDAVVDAVRSILDTAQVSRR